jgi:hypothetical protein
VWLEGLGEIRSDRRTAAEGLVWTDGVVARSVVSIPAGRMGVVDLEAVQMRRETIEMSAD